VNQEVIGRLMDRWTTDAQFRAEVRADAVTAIERCGLTLNDDERAAVVAIDWSVSDAQLAARVSHLPF
jgi:hypothetical protein